MNDKLLWFIIITYYYIWLIIAHAQQRMFRGLSACFFRPPLVRSCEVAGQKKKNAQGSSTFFSRWIDPTRLHNCPAVFRYHFKT